MMKMRKGLSRTIMPHFVELGDAAMKKNTPYKENWRGNSSKTDNKTHDEDAHIERGSMSKFIS